MKSNTLDYDNEILQKTKSVISNYLNYVKQLSNDVTGKSGVVSDEDLIDDISSLFAAVISLAVQMI
jgi:phosphoribosylpyrophosphate synthetase